jgi:hypothetical protein
MTPHALHLRALAERVVKPYLDHPDARAALLTGSTAEGDSDEWSDIDLSVYYERLPDAAFRREARRRNGDAPLRWTIGGEEQGGLAEAYLVDGIEIQIGQTTIELWERQLDEVLVRHETQTPLMKALDGTRIGIALYGADWIGRWKARVADYPDGLAEKLVRDNLGIFAAWGIREHLARRDAALWTRQLLLEAAQQLLGILAGVNRAYYTTFQFKRTRRFAAALVHAPANLAARLETLVVAPLGAGLDELPRLVAETLAIVEERMPSVDVSALKMRLEWRQSPWNLPHQGTAGDGVHL